MIGGDPLGREVDGLAQVGRTARRQRCQVDIVRLQRHRVEGQPVEFRSVSRNRLAAILAHICDDIAHRPGDIAGFAARFIQEGCKGFLEAALRRIEPADHQRFLRSWLGVWRVVHSYSLSSRVTSSASTSRASSPSPANTIRTIPPGGSSAGSNSMASSE